MVPPPRPRESTLPMDCGQSSHLAVVQGMGLGISFWKELPRCRGPRAGGAAGSSVCSGKQHNLPKFLAPPCGPTLNSHHPLPVLSLLQSPGTHRVGVMSQDKRGRPLNEGPHVGGAPGEEQQS